MAALVAPRARGAHVGVALSPTALCAAIQRLDGARVEPWRVALPSLNGDGASWPGLTDGLRALARDSGIADGRLTVALLPPLAEARAVDVPPLNEAELQQLLARGAAKYFVAARGAQVVGAVRTSGDSDAETVPTIAAAASARLVNAIHSAAHAAGWTVDAVIPAEAAWAAAAALWSGRGQTSAQLLVAQSDRTDLLRVDRGQLTSLRRFRAATADTGLIAEAHSNRAGHLVIVGPSDIRKAIARDLSSHGVSIEAPATSADFADQPDVLAAAFATRDATPVLMTDAARAARIAAVRGVTIRLAVAAGVLLLASGALEFWGARRELASIKAQRAAIAPQIASTLVGRTTVENAFRQLQALATEERAAPHWSTAIAALSERLPIEAHLTGFRGRGDSLSIEGLAVHAARVFDAIEKEPTLSGVHAAGPVRIENPADGPPMERFSIAAQMTRPGAPKPAARPASKPSATSGAVAPATGAAR